MTIYLRLLYDFHLYNKKVATANNFVKVNRFLKFFEVKGKQKVTHIVVFHYQQYFEFVIYCNCALLNIFL